MTGPRDPTSGADDQLGSDVQRAVSGFAPTALRQARRRVGWSVSDLALASGVAGTVISGWERGSHQPTITRLRSVAAALNVDVTDLLRPSATAHRTLLDLRIAGGLTLIEAAGRAGVHNSTLSRAESGTALTERTRAALATLYELPESEIQEAWQRGRDVRLRNLRGS